MSELLRRSVLMGDPSNFSVKGGSNPHTRTRWGTKRRVNRARAITQWKNLRDLLEELGIRVLVVPADPAQTGLVYPANAGFQSRVDLPEPIENKCFTLANLLPARAAEKPHYRRVLEASGYRLAELDARYRFEGEADFFPAGDFHLLTYGALERQRFVPALALPPWRRIYGFRTDRRVLEQLAPQVAPRQVLPIALQLETHYHGDTTLCAFGPKREFLLAWRRAIVEADWALLEAHFGANLLPLEERDANRYAANSFTYTPLFDRSTDASARSPEERAPATAPPKATPTPAQPIHAASPKPASERAESFLVMPAGLSPDLLDRIRERGVSPLSVDVSEFLKKGGGSVKCMIGDLGVTR